MISPLRQNFNALAAAFMAEKNPMKANAVMDHAIKYLYSSNLKPTFTDLQTADLLIKMQRNDDARMVAERLLAWTQGRVAEAEMKGRPAEEYELYLLQNAAELLTYIDDSSVDSTNSIDPARQ